MTYWISWTFWTSQTFKTFTDLPDLWTFRIFQGPSNSEITSDPFSRHLQGKFQGPFKPSWPSRSARDLLGTFQGFFWNLPYLPDLWGKDCSSFNLLRIKINPKLNFRFKHIKDGRCGRNGKTNWLDPCLSKWVANSPDGVIIYIFRYSPYIDLVIYKVILYKSCIE